MADPAPSLEQVPPIDFGPLGDASRAGVEGVAAEMRDACEQIGFFYIANHPTRRLFDETAAFFALPAREKVRVSIEHSLAVERAERDGGPGLWLALEASDATNCFGDLSMEMQSAGVPIC